jgi:hypothetical protein
MRQPAKYLPTVVLFSRNSYGIKKPVSGEETGLLKYKMYYWDVTPDRATLLHRV